MPDVALLPPGAAKTTLMTFGVQGWACVSLVMPGRARGILGFDTFRPGWGVYLPAPRGAACGRRHRRRNRARAIRARHRARLAARLDARFACRWWGSSPAASRIISTISSERSWVTPGWRRPRSQQAPKRLCILRRSNGRRTRSRPHRQHPDLRAAVGPRARVVPSALLDETASLLRATLPGGVDLHRV